MGVGKEAEAHLSYHMLPNAGSSQTESTNMCEIKYFVFLAEEDEYSGTLLSAGKITVVTVCFKAVL